MMIEVDCARLERLLDAYIPENCSQCVAPHRGCVHELGVLATMGCREAHLKWLLKMELDKEE